MLYDGTCAFCVRCAHWLQQQRMIIPLECLPSGGEAAARRFPELPLAGAPEELRVVDDEGGVYRDTHAWLMALWALEDYREWALRLSHPSLLPLARNAFELLSSNRKKLSGWLRLGDEAVRRHLEREAGPPQAPKCAPGEDTCRLPSPSQCEACGHTHVPGREFCPHCLAEVVGGELEVAG